MCFLVLMEGGDLNAGQDTSERINPKIGERGRFRHATSPLARRACSGHGQPGDSSNPQGPGHSRRAARQNRHAGNYTTEAGGLDHRTHLPHKAAGACPAVATPELPLGILQHPGCRTAPRSCAATSPLARRVPPVPPLLFPCVNTTSPDPLFFKGSRILAVRAVFAGCGRLRVTTNCQRAGCHYCHNGDPKTEIIGSVGAV